MSFIDMQGMITVTFIENGKKVGRQYQYTDDRRLFDILRTCLPDRGPQPRGGVSGGAPTGQRAAKAYGRTTPKANRSTAMSLENLEREEEELADYEIGFQDRLEGRTSDYRLERRLGLGWLRGWQGL